MIMVKKKTSPSTVCWLLMSMDKVSIQKFMNICWGHYIFCFSQWIWLHKNHWSHLDGAAIWKFWKRRFFGNISNSCHWVTHMGLKSSQIFFSENISKSMARVFQNFGLIEGAAGIPSGLCQIRTLIWLT